MSLVRSSGSSGLQQMPLFLTESLYGKLVEWGLKAVSLEDNLASAASMLEMLEPAPLCVLFTELSLEQSFPTELHETCLAFCGQPMLT